MTIAYVTCPRCHFRMSVKLHQITATDEQACPRCRVQDEISIPMLLMPEQRSEQPEPDVHRSPSQS